MQMHIKSLKRLFNLNGCEITTDAGYFVPNIYFYCELRLYYRFFGKFLFHSANSSCQKLQNEIYQVFVLQFLIKIFIKTLKRVVRFNVHRTLLDPIYFFNVHFQFPLETHIYFCVSFRYEIQFNKYFLHLLFFPLFFV